MLIGDFNARKANNQSLQLNSEGGENNPLWLEESGLQSWERVSRDDEGEVSHFGVELLGLCSLSDMVICNGMRRWPTSWGITCKTYNGQSVVDYVIFSQSFIPRILKFDIGDHLIEMKSDHAPLFVKLDFASTSPYNNQNFGTKKITPSKGKILLNQENRDRFSAALKQQFLEMKSKRPNMTINKAKGHSHVHSNLLIPIIHKALSACKRSRPRKRATSTFSANPWLDEDCKVAKRSLREGKFNKENKSFLLSL